MTVLRALPLTFLLAATVLAAEPASKPVSLKVTGWDGVQQLVAGHRGKIVVVDVWTTTCATCVREFPEFAALEKEFGDRVALISVATDYDGVEGKPPAYYRDKVLGFLKKQNATFENVLLDEPFIEFLDARDLSSTPAVYVYGRKGQLLKRFDNDDATSAEEEFDTSDVRAFVAERLGRDRDGEGDTEGR